MAKKKPHHKRLGTKTTSVGIAARLVAMRVLKGWSQAEAAERIGIAPSTLRSLETGKKLGLVEEMLLRVADVYGTSLDQIYGRSESALERFASAAPDIQSAQLNGIMNGIARLTQSAETLRYVDELIIMTANELPDWRALQSFRDLPASARMSLLQQMALTVARLARDRSAITYLGALIRQFAFSTGQAITPRPTLQRDEHALSRNLAAIDQMFGRLAPEKAPSLTPSRFKIADVTVPHTKTPRATGRSSKRRKKSAKPTRQ